LLALVIAAVVLVLLYFRSERFQRFVVNEIEQAVEAYGLRAEIGGFKAGRRFRTVTLSQVKLFNLQTDQLIATLDTATVSLTIADPFALRLRREVVFDRLEIAGLNLWVEVDEQGRSNFQGLHRAPPRERRIEFDYSNLVGALTDGTVQINDRSRGIEGELRNLHGEARPAGEGELPEADVQLASSQGRFEIQDRAVAIDALEFAGGVSESGLEIERLALRSPMAEATASGRLDDWRALHYRLETQATAKLEEIARLFAPAASLAGAASFNGRIEGQGAQWSAAGQLSSDELAAAGIRFNGVQATQARIGSKDGGLSFSSAEAGARTIRIRGIEFSNATVADVNGAVRNDRVELTARQASASRIKAEQGESAGVTLRNISALLGAGVSEVQGDLSLEKGSFGKVAFSQTTAKLKADQTTLLLSGFKTTLMGGGATGDLSLNIAGGASRLRAEFSSLQTADIFSLLTEQRPPLAGTVTGRADVNWPGTNARMLDGRINASFAGETTTTPDAIPVTGEIAANARRSVFNFDQFALRTDASTLTATGSLAMSGDSNLRFTLDSTRAEELQTIATSFEAAREVFEKYEPRIFGDFSFNGTITGPIEDPTVAGDLNASSVGLRDEILGSLTGRVLLSPAEIRFEQAVLTAANGGTASINYAAPRAEAATDGRLDATLERIDIDAIIAAAGLPSQREFITGEVSGEAHLTGLPAAPRGNVTLNLVNGRIAGQTPESAVAVANFDNQTVRIERVEVRFTDGRIFSTGTIAIETKEFQFQGQVERIGLASLAESFELRNIQVSGTADVTFQASGDFDDAEQFRIELTAQGQQVTINGRDLGTTTLTATTSPGGRIDIALTTSITGRPQPLTASIELRRPGRPIDLRSDLANFDITPLLSIFAPDIARTVSGTVTGRLRISGPTVNARGEATIEGLRGSLSLTDLSLQVSGTPINVETPLDIALADSRINVEPTRITAQGTDLRLGGTLALAENAPINFSIEGAINLGAFVPADSEINLSGAAAIDARIGGTFDDPRLGGEIRLRDILLSSLNSPITLEDGSGRIALSGDRLMLESFTARAGDGSLQASGSVKLAQFRPEEWRFDISANFVDVLWREVRAIADGKLTLAGTPQGQTLSGSITVPLAEYTADFTLSEFGGRGGLSFGGGGFGAPSGGAAGILNIPPLDLDVRVVADESFLIRNEQANTVASAMLNVRGTLSEPDVSGRVTLEGGTINFRRQRYEITAGVLDLPGGFGVEPELRLLAEGNVSTYRVYVGFTGPINDLEVALRSEPELTRGEIISLITTGSTETGTLSSDELVRSGLGTAASLLSQEFISGPLGREAERLLGLNRFQIDPVLRPNENPAARLTIGNQLARGLSFLYSTNLSSEQEQTAIVEYNITSRFSALASYTQGGSSTRQGANDNDFTIEIRGRKSFSLGAAAGTDAGRTPLPFPTLSGRRLPPARVEVNKPEEIKISENRLRELLPVMREGFNRAFLRLGERNLTNYLQEKGYFFAEVIARCEPADCSGPDLRVLYDVRPDQRYDLKEIRITGTDQLNEGEVIADLESRPQGLLGGVPFFERLPLVGGTTRGITSNDRLRGDRETIRRRMADLGFRSVRVQSRLAVSPDSDDLVVIFDVEEGPRSKVAEVALRGNTVAPLPELRELVPIDEGDDFSPTGVRQGAQRIRNYYADRGYLDARTEVSVVDLPDDRVRLIYELSEGSRAVAQETEVTGNNISREESIQRFLDFKPGQVITPQMIRNAQRDLYATGAFREVNIKLEPVAPASAGVQNATADETSRRVTVSVTEAKPLLLLYGLGYSTDQGPSASAQLTHNNLFGRVISGSLKLRGSRREQLAQIQLTDLRPFGMKWATTVSAFYNRDSDLRTFVRRRVVDDQTEEDRAGRSFGINRFTALIQTERKFGELNSLRFRYSMQNAKLFNLENIPEIEVTRNEQAIRLGIFSAGISRDTRDSALSPTRGQLISADHSLAARIFGGNESFNKFFANYQRYHTLPETLPLIGNSTLAFAARIGLAAPFRVQDRDGDGAIEEPERRLPISERFFAGGATTLRGFRFEEAGPQGILEPRNANELPTLTPIGGDALAIFNFEFRYPLTRRFQLVPFYDLGNVFRRVSDINFGRMTNTLGLGLRFNTPIGPVGVDYGYLLDPPSFVTAGGGVLRQPRSVFHIRIGQTF
jgi:outer membrane protein assembly complex protein YaeT